jgi:hypothetical protein
VSPPALRAGPAVYFESACFVRSISRHGHILSAHLAIKFGRKHHISPDGNCQTLDRQDWIGGSPPEK